MKNLLISKEQSRDKTWQKIFHVVDDCGVFSLICKGPFTPIESERESEIFSLMFLIYSFLLLAFGGSECFVYT